jgi:exodeoxyribonuclease V alpha subunit
MSTGILGVEALRELAVLSDLDLHFARAMTRLSNDHDPRVLLAAALVSQRVQAGHVCLDLPRLCRAELAFETAPTSNALDWPALDDWLLALRASPLVGDEHAATPLYLDHESRLYLRRYFEYEHNLARAILERVRRPELPIDRAALAAGLGRLFDPVAPRVAARVRKRASRAQLDLFGAATPDTPDLQRVAAERSVERAFCVISGGPGTGKTSTVVKILALLVEQALAQGRAVPRMLLLAPTGKAAARLSESIKRAKAELRCAEAVRSAIAEEASTLHRALGAVPGSQRFGHDRDTPLAADLIVVDEASMVDLALMARLLEAIPDKARLILLGDKDQLASVEAGAVLGDICGAGLTPAPAARIASSIVHLTHSYRYAQHSGIRQLADAINQGQAERALEILRDPALPEVSLVPAVAGAPVPDALFAAALAGFTPFFLAQGAESKLRALERFRVLCAHRRGAHGQLAVNAGIEAALRDAGLISPRSERYPGRPIIVTQNDYQARLFNGDVGVLLHDPNDLERLRACFVGADARLREIAAARLPPHESVYAMSVHKSQGSELDEVAIVLPAEPSPVLSRELLYTAVTRARKRVVLYASAEVVAFAIHTSVERASGLRDALWRE